MGTPGMGVVLASGKRGVRASGKAAVKNAAGECSECCAGPCPDGGTLLTIDPTVHCDESAGSPSPAAGKFLSVNFGAVGAGDVKITYHAGAVRTSPTTQWLAAWDPLAHLVWYRIERGGAEVWYDPTPGAWGVGFATAADAESNSMGMNLSYAVPAAAGDLVVKLWYGDDICNDNEGTVDFCVEFIPA